jgi:integrase
VLTFKQAAEQVHAAHAPTFRNEKHKNQWLASLEADVFPVFGDMPVDQVQTSDVLRALTPIWTTKPETAQRLRQRIKAICNWARAAGHRSGDNPVEGITMVLPKVRKKAEHHAALSHAQLPAFLERLRAADGSDVVKLAFDLVARIWTSPAERIKAGREHRVPLSPRAVELLAGTKALMKDSAYVFPGRSKEAALSNMVFLMMLRRLGHRDITAHGFRSTFRDWAAEKATFSRSVCEAALAHVVRDKTEAAYFRSDLLEQRRSLMDAWAQFATAVPAKVVSMRA